MYFNHGDRSVAGMIRNIWDSAVTRLGLLPGSLALQEEMTRHVREVPIGAEGSKNDHSSRQQKKAGILRAISPMSVSMVGARPLTEKVPRVEGQRINKTLKWKPERRSMETSLKHPAFMLQLFGQEQGLCLQRMLPSRY